MKNLTINPSHHDSRPFIPVHSPLPADNCPRPQKQGKTLSKILCLLFTLLTPCISPVNLNSEEALNIKGDYLLFSDDHTYLFGSGNIRMSSGDMEIAGNLIYLDVANLTGIIYGGAVVSRSTKTIAPATFHAVFFKGSPPQWLFLDMKETISAEGPPELRAMFLSFIKRNPGELEDSSLYFECREARIDKNRKIKARYVTPFMMGLPTVPLKQFTIHRGNWGEKTLVDFKNINFTDMDGLSLQFHLRLREKWTSGDYRIKLYERGLFDLKNPKRGIIFSGSGGLSLKKKHVLNMETLLNSGDGSFLLTLTHKQNLKAFHYSLSQKFSGRSDNPSFSELAVQVAITPLKFATPTFSFTHDWRKSLAYGLALPLKVIKNTDFSIAWKRNLIRDAYRQDTSAFTATAGLNLPLFAMSSNYNFSRNLAEASARQSFSVNLRLKPVLFLENNVSLDIGAFYMFSAIPGGVTRQDRFTPGLNINLRSQGAQLPLGLELAPTLSVNHLWDNLQDDFTDFNYSLSLRKKIGKFQLSAAYALASRYRANHFWVEGASTRNLNLELNWDNSPDFRCLGRLGFNNQLALENISITTNLGLPWKFRLSSFILFYKTENTFQTLEIFLERVIKNKIKIQGGYSLALKRFFIKFLTL